ncbi:MAG TPA: hypothetical protein VHQ90_06160 [Thermoanaerobaculia bacterium]|nr:hypothetical protein [Thermoanaerobaculia bacterium]
MTALIERGSGAPAAAAAPGPLPFAVLLDEAVRWARRNFRVVFPSVALPIALATSAFAVLQAVWFDPAAMASADPFTALGRTCWIVLATLPLAAAAAIAYCAMGAAAVEAVAGRGVAMRRAWRFALRPAVLGTWLLVMLCYIAALGCCVLPALYVIPLLSLAFPAMVDEGVFGMKALRRSAELTRHNPRRAWQSSPIVRLLALIVVGVLLSYLVRLVFILPLSIAQMIGMARAMSTGGDPQQALAGWLWLQVPASFLSSLGGSAVGLYMSFAIALFFFDARGRREGTDLRQAIEAIAGPLEQLPPAPPRYPPSPPEPRPAAAPGPAAQAPAEVAAPPPGEPRP